MRTGILSIDDKFVDKNVQQDDELNKLLDNDNNLLVTLLKLFMYSNDFDLNRQSLEIIFKCFYQKQTLIKSLKKLQVLTNPKDIALFEAMQDNGKQLQLLVEKTEMWLAPSDIMNSVEFK